MEQFICIRGIAAPLMRANIDTDIIIPSHEMTSLNPEAYGEKLLAPWRYLPSDDGTRIENPDFILNKQPFRNAIILIAGENFGSGSSREAAAWAVRQFGFRCVIAPSFGTIFQNNCYRNGVLPILLPQDIVQPLGKDAERGECELTIDLRTCAITLSTGEHVNFEVPSEERHMMLEGLDAIELTLRRRADISAFQHTDHLNRPWIWATVGSEEAHITLT